MSRALFSCWQVNRGVHSSIVEFHWRQFYNAAACSVILWLHNCARPCIQLTVLPLCTCHVSYVVLCCTVLYCITCSVAHHVCRADPLPLEEMYTRCGEDELGLPLYDCHRGTSGEEGMHGHLNKLFKGGHYGPDFAQVCTQ